MNKIGKPNLEIFSETLLSEAKKNKDIIVVTSDSRGSGKLVPFGKELPDQIIEVGMLIKYYYFLNRKSSSVTIKTNNRI